MAFSDPQSVTIGGSPVSLPRINSGGTLGVFQNSDLGYSFKIRQNVSDKRFRREVRLDISKTAAHPITGLNTVASASVYLVVDEPRFGFNDNDLIHFVDAIKDWATPANLAKLLGGEN